MINFLGKNNFFFLKIYFFIFVNFLKFMEEEKDLLSDPSILRVYGNAVNILFEGCILFQTKNEKKSKKTTWNKNIVKKPSKGIIDEKSQLKHMDKEELEEEKTAVSILSEDSDDENDPWNIYLNKEDEKDHKNFIDDTEDSKDVQSEVRQELTNFQNILDKHSLTKKYEQRQLLLEIGVNNESDSDDSDFNDSSSSSAVSSNEENEDSNLNPPTNKEEQSEIIITDLPINKEKQPELIIINPPTNKENQMETINPDLPTNKENNTETINPDFPTNNTETINPDLPTNKENNTETIDITKRKSTRIEKRTTKKMKQEKEVKIQNGKGIFKIHDPIARDMTSPLLKFQLIIEKNPKKPNKIEDDSWYIKKIEKVEIPNKISLSLLNSECRSNHYTVQKHYIVDKIFLNIIDNHLKNTGYKKTAVIDKSTLEQLFASNTLTPSIHNTFSIESDFMKLNYFNSTIKELKECSWDDLQNPSIEKIEKLLIKYLPRKHYWFENSFGKEYDLLVSAALLIHDLKFNSEKWKNQELKEKPSGSWDNIIHLFEKPPFSTVVTINYSLTNGPRALKLLNIDNEEEKLAKKMVNIPMIYIKQVEYDARDSLYSTTIKDLSKVILKKPIALVFPWEKRKIIFEHEFASIKPLTLYEFLKEDTKIIRSIIVDRAHCLTLKEFSTIIDKFISLENHHTLVLCGSKYRSPLTGSSHPFNALLNSNYSNEKIVILRDDPSTVSTEMVAKVCVNVKEAIKEISTITKRYSIVVDNAERKKELKDKLSIEKPIYTHHEITYDKPSTEKTIIDVDQFKKNEDFVKVLYWAGCEKNSVYIAGFDINYNKLINPIHFSKNHGEFASHFMGKLILSQPFEYFSINDNNSVPTKETQKQ